MNQEIENLAQLSEELARAPLSSYCELLAKRRHILDRLTTRQGPPSHSVGLSTALDSGNDARSRLLVELGALRAKVDELQRLRVGLGQLRPTGTTAPSLDVRL